MTTANSNAAESGLEVLNLADDPSFMARRLHAHDIATQVEGLRRLTQAFVEAPDTVLQELVNSAVDLCGADSAGISVEKEDGTDAEFYHWVATAGAYAGFLNANLPRYPSACGICLERDSPQLLRVTQPFYDLMGVNAPVVTDGILLPWQTGNTRGTFWIMAHGRPEAFDRDDLRLMQVLADFAAMAVRHHAQQRALLQQATAAAAAAMANDLAHQINNPLQSLTNLVFLARHDGPASASSSLAEQMQDNLQRLSTLVQRLLALPTPLPPAHK